MTGADHIDLHEGCSFADLIVRAIGRYPERVALVHGADSITYRVMCEQIAQVGRALDELGLRKGDAVAHLTQNRPEEFYVAAACYLIGLRYVPLHPLGAVDDFAHIIDHSGARLVVVQHEVFEATARDLASRLPDGVRLLAQRDHGPEEGLMALAARQDSSPLAVRASARDVARLAYTGGTTGRPKAVMQTHRSLVTNTLLSLAELEWPKEIRFLCCTPLSHATAYLIVPVLMRGGTMVLQEKYTAASFCEAVQTHRITSTLLVPTMLYALLDLPEIDQYDLSSLDHIIYGAAPTAPHRLREALARFGPVLQQSFGLTESPNCITTLKISDHLGPDERLASCGTPYAGNQVTLRNDEGDEVPLGDVGEVCVRGPLVMDGYWNQPEATAEAFAGGWFHTGDMGYRDADGYIFLVDRKKDLIISGGFNVYAREVEDVLADHPAVAQAAVIGVPDDKWGEAVKALVVLRHGATATAAELAGYVKARKGSVHAPKSVDFIDSLPLTPLGKLDKKSLRAPFWAAGDRQVH